MNKSIMYVKCKAYSLIEIMIVFTIIAALMVGVFQMYKGIKERQKVEKTRTILTTVKNAIEQFRTDVGRLPSGLAELSVPPSSEDKKRWLGPYVPTTGGFTAPDGSVFDDYGKPLEYQQDQSGRNFDLFSWGKGEVGSDIGHISID